MYISTLNVSCDDFFAISFGGNGLVLKAPRETFSNQLIRFMAIWTIKDVSFGSTGYIALYLIDMRFSAPFVLQNPHHGRIPEAMKPRLQF